MVKVTDQNYYIDGYHKTNLDTAKQQIKNDWDMLFLYDGAEGSGKSVKAQQDAYYCDPTLNLDRIVFTPNEFRRAILDAKPYQAVIYDEAYTGLSARATMSMINRTLVSMLAEIRQKNLFVFVVMPTFFDLDRYVAIWRARALIHVYTNGFERGYFSFYNKTKLKDLYINGKKYYSYHKPEANYIGRFVDHYTVDKDAYRAKKRSALMEREKQTEEKVIRQEIEDEIFARIINLDDRDAERLPIDLRAKILGISKPTYYLKLKKMQEKGDLIL